MGKLKVTIYTLSVADFAIKINEIINFLQHTQQYIEARFTSI